MKLIFMIKEYKWSPKEDMLLIVTENAKLYTFTLSNVYIVELVSDLNNNFGASFVMWNTDGRSFVVSDKKQMIIGHPEIGEVANSNTNEEEDIEPERDEDNKEEEEQNEEEKEEQKEEGEEQ